MRSEELTLRDSGTVRIFTSSTAERSPFPSRGRTIARYKVVETCKIGRDTSKSRRAERCRSTRRGEALRRHGNGDSPLRGVGVGWRGSPLRTFKGADSGFRRTACNHPRRA